MGEQPKMYAEPLVSAAHFENFKALASVEIPIRSRLVVLVGPNAVGKSSVLQGIEHFTHAAERRRRSEYFMAEHDPIRLVTIGRAEMTLGLTIAESVERVRVTSRHPPSTWMLPDDEPAQVDVLGRAERMSLEPKRIATPAELPDPAVEEDGYGVPAVLLALAGAEPEIRERIEADLRRVVPRFKRVFMRTDSQVRETRAYVEGDDALEPRTLKQGVPVAALQFEFEGRGRIDADMVSEGTLIVLALLVLFHGPNRPRLMLLDDLDRALHPEAQGRLIEVIGQLLDEHPELQIIATTHSPYLVNHVHPDAVVLMSSDEHGHAHASLLSEHPRFDHWSKTLTSGEMWPYFGEAWVTDRSKALELR